MAMGVGGILMIGLGGLLSLAATVAAIIILIAAFQDEVWKGIVGLLCGFYLIYWAIAEYQAPNKWLWIGLWLGGGIIGNGLIGGGFVASGMMEQMM